MMAKINASSLEVILFVIFVLYIVFQPRTPPVLAGLIDTPVGTGIVLTFAVYLLLYSHPVLGVLSVFVAYELLRRSSTAIQYIPTMLAQQKEQPKVDAKVKSFNPPSERTLEEDVVAQMAPIDVSSDYVETGFKPVSNDLHGASPM
jgi:hypothetical protein